MSFNFEGGEMERLVQEAAAAQLEDVARQMERVVAELTRLHRGRPLEEVRPMLSAAFQSRGWGISEPELSEYARCISEGIQVEVKPGS